jgi:carboxypeptidase C (cathepsin A)
MVCRLTDLFANDADFLLGGHYAPIVAEYFEQQNALNLPGAQNINLQHVLIGNGWYDPLVQYQAYYNFSVFPGNTYNFDPLNKTVKSKKIPQVMEG